MPGALLLAGAVGAMALGAVLGPPGGGRFAGGGPRGLTGILERQVRGTTPLSLRSILVQSA